MIKIKVQRIHSGAVIPNFAHPTDSGFDLYTCEDTKIESGQKAILKTGLKFEIPQGWGIQLKNKSGVTVKGCPIYSIVYVDTGDGEYDYVNKDMGNRADVTVYEGTIDMNYRGEIGIMVKNETDKPITIPKHTKVAQGVLRQVFQCKFVEVNEIDTNTDRGEGGYGSTGAKHE